MKYYKLPAQNKLRMLEKYFWFIIEKKFRRISKNVSHFVFFKVNNT